MKFHARFKNAHTEIFNIEHAIKGLKAYFNTLLDTARALSIMERETKATEKKIQLFPGFQRCMVFIFNIFYNGIFLVTVTQHT